MSAGLGLIATIATAALTLPASIAGVVYLRQNKRQSPAQVGQRVFGYQVTDIPADADHRAESLLGSVFTEATDLGATHQYRIEHDLLNASVLTAVKLPGTGVWMGGMESVDWDDVTTDAIGNTAIAPAKSGDSMSQIEKRIREEHTFNSHIDSCECQIYGMDGFIHGRTGWEEHVAELIDDAMLDHIDDGSDTTSPEHDMDHFGSDDRDSEFGAYPTGIMDYNDRVAA